MASTTSTKDRLCCSQLTHHRNQITQSFNRVFAIENQLPGVLHTTLPYNISASKPLHHFSAIFIAMEILALGFKQLSLTTLSRLIQSASHCQNEADANMGANLDIFLRQNNCPEVPVEALYAAIATWQIHFPKTLG